MGRISCFIIGQDPLLLTAGIIRLKKTFPIQEFWQKSRQLFACCRSCLSFTSFTLTLTQSSGSQSCWIASSQSMDFREWTLWSCLPSTFWDSESIFCTLTVSSSAQELSAEPWNYTQIFSLSSAPLPLQTHCRCQVRTWRSFQNTWPEWKSAVQKFCFIVPWARIQSELGASNAHKTAKDRIYFPIQKTSPSRKQHSSKKGQFGGTCHQKKWRSGRVAWFRNALSK